MGLSEDEQVFLTALFRIANDKGRIYFNLNIRIKLAL